MGNLLRCIVAALAFWLGQGPVSAGVVSLTQAEAALPGPGGQPGDWRPVALPDDWETSFPGHSGAVWYRLYFDSLPDAAQGHGLMGVYIRRACTNVEVFLNGELVGSGGLMTEPVTRNCYYPQLFSLPRAVLRPQRNELRIRLVGYSAREVSARQRAAGLSPVEVGLLADLQPEYDHQLFWNVTVAQIIAVTICVLGAAMLGLAAVRRKDSYLLFFGLFSVGWAGISTRLFVQHVPLSYLHTEVLICSAFPPVLGCAYLFLLRFVDYRSRWIDGFLLLQALLVPVVLLSINPAHLLAAASTVYNLTALEFLVCVAIFARIAWRGRRREFWLMSLVLVMAIVLAAIEIALQNNLLPLPKIHVIHFAMPFLFLVIGVRLIQLFVQALNRAESVNVELEKRVAEKSREIEHNYAQLTELRTEQAAQSERQRIASDLHDDLGAKLLTIAQASDSERVAGMARQALEEMRLSVRGLTASPARAEDVLADWRAESVSRLAAAGFESEWIADEPAQGLVLPARTHVQLTRVLREAVSNVIRHSGGRRCRIRINLWPDALELEVADDGRGLPGGARSQGHGLPGIERRVHKLAGRHALGPAPGGGTLLQVVIPLEVQSANIDLP
ncbi:MAG: histidine kinase [Ramlibacter sp.]|nr:histidine kinase [Ramlibacter sp.]